MGQLGHRVKLLLQIVPMFLVPGAEELCSELIVGALLYNPPDNPTAAAADLF
jgi:hypothetical protein